jgi:hypothetical protein
VAICACTNAAALAQPVEQEAQLLRSVGAAVVGDKRGGEHAALAMIDLALRPGMELPGMEVEAQ